MRNPTLKTLAAAAVVALAAATGTAQAALHARDGGMVYDDVLNLTWLADMNYAQTSGQSRDGLMDLATAKAWAEGLNYGGLGGWRLPTLNPGDTSCGSSVNVGGGFGTQYGGFNCTGGELSHLFAVDLGNKAWETVLNPTGDTTEQQANLALFKNVQAYVYWSGTEYAPTPGNAWIYTTHQGAQATAGELAEFYAVAVHSGDVAAVPEPQSYALLIAGLSVLALTVRRRSR
ncbi:PEP-CTERM sorting domain-containing protein [Roseateles sp. LKC17W]|uniref:PEP-CTERM sorting domain-containing protein n=1 Tax=Pelomonas margarita TaxID=3299031 RepID=A0ABW7FPH5_9BURK